MGREEAVQRSSKRQPNGLPFLRLPLGHTCSRTYGELALRRSCRLSRLVDPCTLAWWPKLAGTSRSPPVGSAMSGRWIIALGAKGTFTAAT
jgi:hypothetical protein